MELTENLQHGQSAVNSGAAADEQASAPLSLEVGKWYQCRDSNYVANIKARTTETALGDYPMDGYLYGKSGGKLRLAYFAQNGVFDLDEENNDYDLIKEVSNPFEGQQEEEQTGLRLKVGRFYECRNGYIVEIDDFCKGFFFPFLGNFVSNFNKEDGKLSGWKKNGRHGFSGESDCDLIKEVPNPLGEKQATQTAQTKTDTINHPAYYGGADNPYEVIKVVEEWKLDFHLGNAVKYIARAGKKDADKTIEDLQKAIWYIQRKIEKVKQDTE